jgi:hypothetical protein
MHDFTDLLDEFFFMTKQNASDAAKTSTTKTAPEEKRQRIRVKLWYINFSEGDLNKFFS